MFARIYSPARSVTQSGKARTGFWVLELVSSSAKFVESFMRYNAQSGASDQVQLRFPTCQQAIDYAEKQGIAYRVEAVHPAKRLKRRYADNFCFERYVPWTH